MQVSITRNYPFTHKFCEGFEYEGMIVVDGKYEKVEFKHYIDEDKSFYEETKWMKKPMLFPKYRLGRQVRNAEKRLHKRMEEHYRHQIKYTSAFKSYLN